MTEQALRYDTPMSSNEDGVVFSMATVTDPRMDRSRCSEYFIVAIPQGRPGIPVEARPVEVTLRGFSHYSITEADGTAKHVQGDVVFARRIISSPNIKQAISRGAKEFGQLFQKPIGG